MSVFIERGLSRTRARNAILVLVSQLERHAAIVADTGIIDRIPQRDLDGITAIMDDTLVREGAAAAMTRGLPALEQLLRTRGFNSPPASGDEISEEFLETEGPKQ
jgi:putative membrane protein